MGSNPSSRAEAAAAPITPQPKTESVLQWAAQMVTGLSDRTKVLVGRVFTTKCSQIAPEAQFLLATDGRETWSQETVKATQFNKRF